ncbi:serine/threonine-protein kinase [Arenimonas donghaensis]|uniref:Protein kinase domain-containing protein n=1 Tax=Arenimonas donghaensis DSM 18148 = HO3-R19 TaxID=1121014 RepID=A0A087ML64_9GAMM|nr:serine/threonine-protein kinase [Arenimonas donghaensis]KFL37617.1 hypothetical protein N788_00160 [Arenimonas donghaensis DSM 18148 = HO3-R19]
MGGIEDDDLAPTEGLPTRAGPGEPPAAGAALAPGARLGRYRIDGVLGRGGMGEVYRASQLEPVRRTVAIKLLHARRLDARHLAYFEVERQLLAQMKHPAIAQVYDAGATPEGFPFFVMEFIEGRPLTSFCEEHGLSLRERLALFIRVCEGVQHAHQKGVIHRDLKPGNILVSEVDGRPLPKIIDFGIATAASRSLAAGERAGELERAGTPDYMSPEQAGLEGVEVDTRSDVYSLGVLLYELLAGRRPGVGEDSTAVAHTASTTIRPPSAQIETLAPGSASARAGQLGLSKPRLRRVLRSELDWVVLKAMRRDRAERYSSAAELVQELQRFLEDRPLQAVPPSRRYVLGKYLRRHRLGLAAAASVSLAVLSGLAVSLYSLQQAREQRELAEQRSADLERVTAFQQSMLEDIDVETMGQGIASSLRDQVTKAAPATLPAFEQALAATSPPDLARELVDREILASALLAIERDFADQPGLAAELRNAIGQVQLALGLPAQASKQFQAVADFHERVHGAAAIETLAARSLQADAMARDGRPDEALALVERILGDAASLPDGADVRLDVESQQASLVFVLGDRPRARAMQQALYDRERTRRGADDPKLLMLLDELGLSRGRMGEIAEARAIFEDLYARRRASLGPEHETTLNTMGRLAVMRAMDGDLAPAAQLQRERAGISARKLGAEHPVTLSERGNLANMLLGLRQYEEAEALMRSVLEARQRLYGDDAAVTLRTKLNLASLLARRRQFEEALRMEDELLQARRRLLGPEHPDTVFLEVNHASTMHRAARPTASVQAQLDRARPLAVRVLGTAHPQTVMAEMMQGLVWLRAGQLPQAIGQFEALRARAEAGREPGDEPNARLGWALAQALDRAGNPDRARAVLASDVQWLLDLPADQREARHEDVLEFIQEETANRADRPPGG